MKISVITVCRNAENVIEETMQSVLSQTYSDVEYIIVDGGSTDKTLSIIEKYRDKIAFWVSEPDNGIYDAMNKGIKAATGDVLNFLNAGDVFYDSNVLKKVANTFIESNPDVLYSEVIYFNPETNRIFHSKFHDIDNMSVWYDCICHQGIFYRAKSFETCGNYRTDFKIHGDIEWFLRAIKRGLKFKHLNYFTVKYREGGISSQKSFLKLSNVEKKEILNMYYKNKFALTLYGILFDSIYKFLRRYFKLFTKIPCIGKAIKGSFRLLFKLDVLNKMN